MKRRFVSFLLVVMAVATASGESAAQSVSAASRASARAIEYTVTFPAPQTHYAEVVALIPADRRPSIDVMMAVWTPGSYLVREYERNVENVVASAGGKDLPIEKTEKNRWRITTAGVDVVSLRYRVYAREMSVRTNWIDAGFALLNGAPTFLTLADSTVRPHDVTIVPPAAWKKSFSALPEVAGSEHRYRAPDYDTLVDSPILVGNAASYEFTVDGKRHLLVNEGEGGVFDGARAARDLEKVVREHRRMWGFLPYDQYVFFNLLTESSGGLEHKNSNVLMASRWATRTRPAYVSWLELASHEYFHAWNVKRLRPVELGPFNYEREVPTRSLWIAEGITDYYGDLAVTRAGFLSRDEFLGQLSGRIEDLQGSPGRLVQSAEQASYDAWIKYYRPDENSGNVSISYYTKGALLGFLLDAKVRAATGGKSSLDDVMKAAYQKYSGDRGYTPAEFRAVAEQVAGVSLAAFWTNAVEGTGELDYSDALQAFGLRLRVPLTSSQPWLGISNRNDNGRLVVAQVRRGAPADTAGINVDDEIVAIDDFRVRVDRFDSRLEQYRVGDRISVLVARREQLLRIDVTLAGAPGRGWRLEVDPAAKEAAVQMRTRWLTPAP
jgi:predicted metalloprotease with PDZ domain